LASGLNHVRWQRRSVVRVDPSMPQQLPFEGSTAKDKPLCFPFKPVVLSQPQPAIRHHRRRKTHFQKHNKPPEAEALWGDPTAVCRAGAVFEPAALAPAAHHLYVCAGCTQFPHEDARVCRKTIPGGNCQLSCSHKHHPTRLCCGSPRRPASLAAACPQRKPRCYGLNGAGCNPHPFLLTKSVRQTVSCWQEGKRWPSRGRARVCKGHQWP
jgi:hypothetical protein